MQVPLQHKGSGWCIALRACQPGCSQAVAGLPQWIRASRKPMHGIVTWVACVRAERHGRDPFLNSVLEIVARSKCMAAQFGAIACDVAVLNISLIGARTCAG